MCRVESKPRMYLPIVSMASIIDILYRDFIRPYKRIVLIVFLIIIFIIATYYAYQWYAVPKMNKTQGDDVANANRRGQPIEIYFFFANWCPHCKTAKPAWDGFKNRYDNQEYNEYKIHCIEVNCTNMDESDKPNYNPDAAAMISQFEVKGFPTLKMVKGGTVIDFDSKITSTSLDKFMALTLN